MTSEEVKIRQMTNQHLLRDADKATVVRDLCGVQAQFLSNAFHSLKIRCADYDENTVSDGLVKNWTLRGTVHLFAEDDLPLFLHCENGQTYRSHDWSRPSFWNQRPDWVLTPQRQQELSELILTSLHSGTMTRDELKSICRAGGMTEAEEACMFHPWGGGVRELCERGWMHGIAQEEKAYCLTPAFEPIPKETAKLELARRYFTHMAPATIRDAMYFFRATAKQVKQWLAQLPVSETQCQGKTYYYIKTGRTYPQDIPSCLFLAGFDQLMLGYEKKESLYLPPEHLRKIFNLAGIVMPAVLLNGQVVGRWKKKDRKLTIEAFTPLSQAEQSSIEECASTLWTSTVKEIAFT